MEFSECIEDQYFFNFGSLREIIYPDFFPKGLLISSSEGYEGNFKLNKTEKDECGKATSYIYDYEEYDQKGVLKTNVFYK